MVEIDHTCAMCGIMNEDTMHSLVMCDYANSIWTQSHLPIPLNVTNIFHAWFSDLLNSLDTNGIIYAAAILYYIWKARNGAVWDACLPRRRRVIAAEAIAVMHAWRQVHPDRGHYIADETPVHLEATATLSPQNTAAAHTAALLELSAVAATGRRRCLLDAGYWHETGKATIGAIILSEDGRYVSAFNAPLPDCSSPLMTEAFACNEVLSWLWDRGVRSIELFTDCLTLQQYLSSATTLFRSYIGYAFDTCRTRIASFEYCLVSFIPRSDNYLAYSLASTAFTQTSVMYWDSVAPNSISSHFE
ncbi:PREDICTED: uncharacterized protein LOC109167450 [Ipomoea nil]|uniref:uncharacterized protein LOC109167450 n=1 Tax=Ipomoea nil TaxID=35883 RepID=UPI0009019818|nr:PREDICTED: uncharacterized protein LOC109167450 [Ipomoea nil]